MPLRSNLIKNSLPIVSLLCFVVVLMLPRESNAQALDTAFGIGAFYKYDNYAYANDMHVDTRGNMYLAGTLEDINTGNKFDFDPGPDVHYLETLESFGCVEDAYVAKYDAGMNFLWGFVVGGTTCDSALSMALDKQDNVYISGRFGNTADFDPGPGELLLDGFAFNDGYVAKYDTDGAVQWAFKLEGASKGAADIEIDKQGNIYIAGNFSDPLDLDPSDGEFLLEPGGVYDIFLAKYNKEGAFLWGAGLGGDGTDRVTGIELDDTGNVTIAGSFSGTMDMDPGPREDIFDAQTGDDVFVAQFDKNGRYTWGFHLGGDDLIFANDLTVAANNDVYLTGSFASETGLDFDPGADTLPFISGGNRDAYVAHFNTSGILQLAMHFGGEGSIVASQVSVHADGSMLVAGGVSGSAAADMDPGPAAFEINDNEFHDSFLARYTKDGYLDWAFGIGYATYGMVLNALEIDNHGRMYMAGEFGEAFSNALDFDPTESEYIVEYIGGNQDIFVARYLDPDPVYRVNAGGAAVDADGVAWSADTKSTPSAYVNVTGANNKTAQVTDAIYNPTPADAALYASYRWDPREREELPMQWHFPVEAGDYKVCMLFVESEEEAEGARVFDVAAEGNVYLDDLDVYAATGLHTGLRTCFFAQVADTELALTLVPEKTRARPLISGIEITPATATGGGVSGNEVSPLRQATRLTPNSGPVLDTVEIPETTALNANYPNPFNPSTAIRFSLAEHASVTLTVYDMLGREVQRLVDGNLGAGYHEVFFDAANLSSGSYLYKLETPAGTFTRTMMLLK